MHAEREPAHETDAALVERLQAGELDAFDRLFEKYRRKLLAYVLGLLHDRERAEDVVQESFVELVKKIRKIDPKRGVSPWLYRVARNRSIDVLRRRKFEVLPGDDFLAETVEADTRPAAPAPDAGMMAMEQRREVGRMLDSLPEKERDLLMLRFYGDLTFAEIAQVVRRPLGTVLWQVNNSLKKLRKGRAKDEHR